MKILQREEEISWFVDLLVREGVRSYLEIGSKFGGSLDRVARALPAGSKIVSVDLPGKAESKQNLARVVAQLCADGYDATVIYGDSTSDEVVQQAFMLAPFDAVFIDANHLLPYVTADWQNYGPMGRIVAFHDIAYVPKPDREKKEIEVPEFWESIKGGFRHEECKLDGPHNGIGVLWRS